MSVKKTIVYGAGDYYERFGHLLPNDMQIIAFADSNREIATSKTGQLKSGLSILSPEELQGVEYDIVVIAPTFGTSWKIFQQFKDFKIAPSKIRFLNRDVGAFTSWTYTINEDYVVTNKIGNVCICEKTRSDSMCVEEAFGSGFYRINVPHPDTVVIDFGMNIADFALFYADNINVKKIYGYEPFPDTYQDAIDNIELNNEYIKSKIETFCVAASDKDGEEYIKVQDPNYSGGRSVLENEVGEKGENGIKIIYRPAGKIIKEIIDANPGSPIFLKCDTEGSEFPIFDSIEEYGLFDSFDCIMMEYHKDPAPIKKILDDHGYRYLLKGETDLGMIYAFH